MSSNFNNLEQISETMIVIISVASFIILILVFLFWLKNRVHEIGVFISLGTSKMAIIGQIWSEAVIIALLSIILSFGIAPSVSQIAADYLVSQQVQQLDENAENDKGKVSTEYVEPQQNVQSVNVNITPAMYLIDGVAVLSLITVSVMVTGIVILKKIQKIFYQK